MLYRAKRAVIIGDPKQLSHISTLSKKQDLSLLQKYEVNMGWSYSANSLYAMASGLTSPDQIVQLRDHHRSFGDIIEFSNEEFYDGRLRVATNYDRLRCPRNVEAGIRWLYADFKKQNGYLRSTQLARQYHLYRQNYCGCIFSDWTRSQG